MEVIKVVTGVLDENCYVLRQDDSCLVVDPGDDYTKIKEAIGEHKVLGVLLTHSHFDHIGALRNFLTKRSVKIFKKSNVLEQGYQLGPFAFTVLFTPGHSKDSITFYFQEENLMFVGDFIFKNSIGRCDLPGGDEKEMQQSISKIKVYDKGIVLYPGHNESTSLGEELNTNPYLS